MRVVFKEAVEIPGIAHALRIDREDVTSNSIGVVVPYAMKDGTEMEALIPWSMVKTALRPRSAKDGKKP